MAELKQYIGKNMRQYGIWLALLAIVVLFQILTSGLLLKPNNIASLIQQNAYVMILAIGMVMVIVARHIDLSVGSVVAFVGGVTAILMKDWGTSWLVAILIALVLGALIGAWQGFWVAVIGIPAFIVTLGGMLIFRGLAIVLVGKTISGLPPEFNAISNGAIPNKLGYVGDMDAVTLLIGGIAIGAVILLRLQNRLRRSRKGFANEPMTAFIGGLIIATLLIGVITYLLSKSAGGTPYVLIIVGVLIVVYSFIMNRTVFGRHIYAVGGNLRAAMLSGLNTRRVDFLVFVNMGVLAALAGVVTTARAGAAVAQAGTLFELDAIAAAFIGGTAVTGGVGRISGAIVGALIMGVLNMGLSIMSVDPAWQQAIKGLVLIIAVAFDLSSKKRA